MFLPRRPSAKSDLNKSKGQALPEYVKTLKDLADRLGVSTVTLHAMRKGGMVFPLKTQRGYNLDEFKARFERFRESKEEERGQCSDTRERKLLLECDRLKVNIDIDNERLKQATLETKRQHGEMVPKELHDAIHDAYTAMFLDGLEQIIENVSTRLRDPKAKQTLRHAVDGLRTKISQQAGP